MAGIAARLARLEKRAALRVDPAPVLTDAERHAQANANAQALDAPHRRPQGPEPRQA
jgi:hypothetical protein